MKSAILFGLCLLSFVAKAAIFEEDVKDLTFTEGISYDFRVYTKDEDSFIGHFKISEADAKAVRANNKEVSAILYLRMTGMSYNRRIYVQTNVTNATGTYAARSNVISGDSISTIFSGGDLNTYIMDLPKNSCNNGCDITFSLVGECDYTCFRSIGVRASMHAGNGPKPIRHFDTEPDYTPLTLHEWSSEVKLDKDSVTNPACFVIDIDAEGEDSIEHLVTTERSNDGSPILVLAGYGENQRPTQNSPDWVMVNAQNYRDFKNGKNYICISLTDEMENDVTIARIKIGAASTLSVSLFLLFAIVTLLF